MRAVEGGQTQPNESYSYDANGNRTSSTSSAAVVIGTDNELLFDGAYTYTYDADGNCTAKFIDVNHTGVLSTGDTDVTQYTWDADSRLVQVTTSATYGAVAQTVVYLYDAEGRWIGENIENGAGAVTQETRFVYDGDQIVLQFDASSPLPSGEGQGEGSPGEGQGEGGAVQMTAADLSHRYLWGPAVDQILSDEQLSPLPPGEGQGEGGYDLTQPGTLVLPLTDNLGTVRDLAICDLTTGTTAVVNHLEYNSFGQLLSQTNPATGNTAAVDCLFGFTGRPFDTNTDLQNNGRRWYNASLGRWESPDPTEFTAGDTNLYRYVGNSPTNATDPTGLWTRELWQIVAYWDEKEGKGYLLLEFRTVPGPLDNWVPAASWIDVTTPSYAKDHYWIEKVPSSLSKAQSNAKGLWVAYSDPQTPEGQYLRQLLATKEALLVGQNNATVTMEGFLAEAAGAVMVGGVRMARGGGGFRGQGAANLREMGLEDVELAGKSYNSGRRSLEGAGFELVETTSTGRKVFRNAKTGAEVYWDGTPKSLAPGQDPALAHPG